MRHPLFMEQLRACTAEMVQQHCSHPSVFIWGTLNECADNTDYGAACYREIFSLLREMDPSRPVTAALLDRPGLPRDAYYAFVCEKCAPVFDYYGFFRTAQALRARAEAIHERA